MIRIMKTDGQTVSINIVNPQNYLLSDMDQIELIVIVFILKRQKVTIGIKPDSFAGSERYLTT